MNILGVIPARGGSKRVPRKNIRLFGGKPLIAYTIEAAKRSKHLTRTLVSTDSPEIAEIAKQQGGDVPFLRPGDLATDSAPDRPYLLHALTEAEKADGVIYDAVVILRPTSPLRSTESIDKVLDFFLEKQPDSVRSVCLAEGVHHPYWMYSRNEEDGKASGFVEGISIYDYFQSQLLPPCFHLNGLVDVISREALKNEAGQLYGEDMRIVETEQEESLDIDTEFDFKLCEAFLKVRQQG